MLILHSLHRGQETAGEDARRFISAPFIYDFPAE
jgi:hypothetical protein